MQGPSTLRVGAFALVGPTSVGKTEVAAQLLRTFPFEVINLDSFQVYEELRLGTGRSDATYGEQGHLYGVVSIADQLPSDEFVSLSQSAMAAISQRGHLVLFEGGSISYLTAIVSRLPVKVIGLRPPSPAWLRAAFKRRIAGHSFQAVADEVRRARGTGPAANRLLNDDVVYKPMSDFVDGQLTEADAIERVLHNLERRAETQMSAYASMDVEWVTAGVEAAAEVVEIVRRDLG